MYWNHFVAHVSAEHKMALPDSAEMFYMLTKMKK